jgi:hypothetical protein
VSIQKLDHKSPYSIALSYMTKRPKHHERKRGKNGSNLFIKMPNAKADGFTQTYETQKTEEDE